ncbi:MAG: hypothetical protein R2873_26270 [Caldilineaceae bacterium]
MIVRQFEIGQQPAEIADLPDDDAEICQLGGAQGGDGDSQHFGVGLRRGRADQLDAGLQEFTLPPGLGRDIAEDAAGVAKALRHGPVVEAGGDEPGQRRGEFGAQRQGGAVAVEEAVHLAAQCCAGLGAERIGELERGRDHVAVAPTPKRFEQDIHHLPTLQRLGPEIVGHAVGDRVLHGQSLCLSLRIDSKMCSSPFRCDALAKSLTHTGRFLGRRIAPEAQ